MRKEMYKVGDIIRGETPGASGVIEGPIDEVEARDREMTYRVRANWLWTSTVTLVSAEWQPKVGDRVNWTRVRGEFDGSIVESQDGVYSFILRATNGNYTYVLARELESAPLKIEAGRYYKTRDGRKVGPAEHDETLPWADDGFVWKVGIHSYNESGEFGWGEDSLDLIAEWPSAAPTSAPVAAQVDTLAEEYGPVVKAPHAGNDNEPKFKVMDRVRFEPGPYILESDQRTGTIISVDSRGTRALIDVKIDNYSGRALSFHASEVTLLTTSSAIVCLITDGQPLPSASPHVHATVGAAQREAERMAENHKGQAFGVYVLKGEPVIVAKPEYKHEWQKLAAAGQKIQAIKLLRGATDIDLKAAKDAVEDWLSRQGLLPQRWVIAA